MFRGRWQRPCDHASVGIDGKIAAIIVDEAVGDGIVGGIGIASAGGDADQCPDSHVLVHALTAGLLSVTAPVSNSSRSLMAIVKA